jgi:hypothetical protein
VGNNTVAIDGDEEGYVILRSSVDDFVLILANDKVIIDILDKEFVKSV